MGDEIPLQADDGTALMSTIIGMIPAPSEEVEGVVLLRLATGSTEQHEDPNAFPQPQVVRHPFQLSLEPLGGPPVFCSPLRYNLGGLIAYDCPTLPAMSGLVVKSTDTKPFAIHLGRKGSLGYGLVLGRIRNEILAALSVATGEPK